MLLYVPQSFRALRSSDPESRGKLLGHLAPGFRIAPEFTLGPAFGRTRGRVRND
jgi:hypothetical protein